MTDQTDAGTSAPKKRGGGLSTMLLADLKAMAGGLGIAGAGSMKKAQLVEAIKAAQAVAGQSGGAPARGAQRAERAERAEQAPPAEPKQPKQDQPKQQAEPKQDQPKQDQPKQEQPKQDRPNQQDQQAGQDRGDQDGDEEAGGSRRNRRRRGRDRQAQGQQGQQGQGQQERGQAANDGGREGGRDAREGREGRRQRGEVDTTILEDDVLVPAAGILDVLDNYAFVRTSGYLPGADDVYVSLSMVRRYGLRSGDAVVGQVRQPREGERREKFNPMVRIDAVNGLDPEASKSRPEFTRLVPTHPTRRLRMERGADDLVGRLVDLAAPVGRGSRGLLVSPAKAGKTTVLRSIAASVAANDPDCHLMVVLVDERPEEVTDFQRSVKGEVIASTFDRPPGDHVLVAELAVERAKRLVELGHDVVVLLDGITRLGRAYNLAAPANGRVVAGGVDAAALHPPKRLFGAARDVEGGGSLTILATALVESGSRTDEAVLEEVEGTGNLELRLRRDLADRGLFPAVDVVRSGTRHEELLRPEDEQAAVRALRAELAGLDPVAAAEELQARLDRTRSNAELLGVRPPAGRAD